jgi:hypothetical protein
MLLVRTLAVPNTGVGIGKNHQWTLGVTTPSCFVLCLHPLQLDIGLLQQDSTEIPSAAPVQREKLGWESQRAPRNVWVFIPVEVHAAHWEHYQWTVGVMTLSCSALASSLALEKKLLQQDWTEITCAASVLSAYDSSTKCTSPEQACFYIPDFLNEEA